MSYTSVLKVREFAGFVGNDNVTDAQFATFIRRAEGRVRSRIRRVYALPLPKYYLQTIVFSGAGTGSGTMTVTIGGESFAVPITSGMTAAQAADALRRLAVDNGTFVIDELGDGATVSFWNVDGGDPDQVTVTSTDPQTVAGIVATAGTVTETSIPQVENITTGLAAAFALIQEYGKEAQDSDKDGVRMLSVFTKDLDEIASKKQFLLDFAENEIPRSDTARLRFRPNATTETDPDDPTPHRLPMNKGY